MIFEWPWHLAEIPKESKRANITLIFRKEDPRNYQPVICTSVPGKVMGKILLGSIFKHIKDRKVISSSQHGFKKGKSC